MKTRLGVAVAALMLGAQLGSPAAAQQPTLEQLELISQYIDAGDIESLIRFIAANPELMEGETAIAIRLREFMIAAGDLSRFLAFDPQLARGLTRGLTEEGSEAAAGFGAGGGSGGGSGAGPATGPGPDAGANGTDDAGTGDANDGDAGNGEAVAGDGGTGDAIAGDPVSIY
jgi:hypothetical protein